MVSFLAQNSQIPTPRLEKFTLLRHYNRFSLEGYATWFFHSPFDRKTTVITWVDGTFLRRDLRENRS